MNNFTIQNLDIPAIGDLWGHGLLFSVEAYQRGYRWKRQQVWKLLADIMKASIQTPNKPYMLQPIVLRDQGVLDREDGTIERRYELIDGQQRLTCIWIILAYLKHKYPGIFIEDLYKLEYKTRPQSGKYLRSLALSDETNPDPESIDEEHFLTTYECAKDFFENNSPYKWFEYLKEHVHVIWYVVEEALREKSAEDIFMSLNRGRIPLTDSELVKTLLLVRTMNRNERNELKNPQTQTEIGTQWDEMERHLADEDFWAFLAGELKTDGKPRMNYLLSVLPHPHGATWQDESDDDFKIFNRYSDLIDDFVKNNYPDNDGEPRFPTRQKYVHEGIWLRHIRASYLRLCNWAEDAALFHKIGFLVAVQENGETGRVALLQELLALDLPKWKVEQYVDNKIRKLFEEIKNLDELNYNQSADKSTMEKLLLLFNVVSCMDEAQKAGSRLCERYSFARHFDKNPVEEEKFHTPVTRKQDDETAARQPWSLEHVNPQKEMRTLAGKQRSNRDDWFSWLEEHYKFLDAASEEKLEGQYADLKFRTKQAIDAGKERMTEEQFKTLYTEIVSLFNAKFDPKAEHGLGNMALLRKGQNSSLGDSAFIVKRSKISQFISQGEFVPLCTRRVFLKYYTDDKPGEAGSARKYSFAFWTNDDAKSYVEEIRKRLTFGPTDKENPTRLYIPENV